jgi:hypothetical protein
LADLGAMRGGQLIPTQSSALLKVASLVLQKGAEKQLLLASFDRETQVIRVKRLKEQITICELDEFSFETASCLPESYRTHTPSIQVSNKHLEITLHPYAYLCINVSSAIARISYKGKATVESELYR